MSFGAAFQAKEGYLRKTLDVSGDLLANLKDRHILTDEHVEHLTEIKNQFKIASKLVEILKRRDPTLLYSFYDALFETKQDHVVKELAPEYYQQKKEQKPVEIHSNVENVANIEPLTQDLRETQEPDYLLPDNLYGVCVISDEQRQLIREEKPVHNRVSCLLQAVKKYNSEGLKDSRFLKALKDDNQTHVANLITTDGNIGPTYGDIRPLVEQQRRRLLNHKVLLEDMNSRSKRLRTLLVSNKVVSDLQSDHVKAEKTRYFSNARLLRIMRRRSVADVKNFIKCLAQTNQKKIANQLTDAGVVACLHTNIGNSTLSAEDQLLKEGEAADNFTYGHPGKCQRAEETCERMSGNGQYILGVEVNQSLVWFILCLNLPALESLRRSYEAVSGELTEMLSTIFNSLCCSIGAFQLHIEWSDNDYEECKAFFNESSGLPFGLFSFDCQSNTDEDDQVK